MAVLKCIYLNNFTFTLTFDENQLLRVALSDRVFSSTLVKLEVSVLLLGQKSVTFFNVIKSISELTYPSSLLKKVIELFVIAFFLFIYFPV